MTPIRTVSRTEFGEQTEFRALDSTGGPVWCLQIDCCHHQHGSPPIARVECRKPTAPLKMTRTIRT
eukprot:698033-Pyramimonas_sp.AAC.1